MFIHSKAEVRPGKEPVVLSGPHSQSGRGAGNGTPVVHLAAYKVHTRNCALSL
jgi:hypothetical protein